jgi:hypothetical protein
MITLGSQLTTASFAFPSLAETRCVWLEPQLPLRSKGIGPPHAFQAYRPPGVLPDAEGVLRISRRSYRDGYADLCRVYMTPDAASWYLPHSYKA